MKRGHGNLQRDREEQLQLRGQLANVYEVVRDLGLHYEMKEISGCSFITIGRTKHKFSHLDENLTWTVPTVRGGANDDVQYVEQTNVLTGNNTVSTSENDEAILSLQKSGQEQADVIAWLNLQLTDLASRLLLANNLVKDEAGIKQSLCRTAQEQEEEMKRLNLQLSSQSSQLLANTVKEETLLNLQEATLKQEEECAKLNQKLGQLSLLLETTTETKEKAELSATRRGEFIEELYGRIDRSDNLRRAEDDFAKQNIERQKKEISTSLRALEDSERKLFRASEEIEDKSNEITVISDLNKGLNRKISKLVQKADQLQEDYELQLAFQHNLTLKKALPEAPAAKELKAEKENHLSQTPNSGQEEEDREITDALNKHKDEPAEPKDCQEAEAERSSQAILTKYKVTILEWKETVVIKSDTIATAVVDQFISAFLDDKFFGSERDPHCYTQTVMRGIMSEEGLENIDEVIEEVTKSVDNVDKFPYAGELEMGLAECLGNKIQHNLQRLLEILHDLKLFQEPWLPTYTKAEISSIFQNQFLEKTKEICKDYVTEMDMADILKKGMGYLADLDSNFSDSTEEKDLSCEESEDEKDISTAPNNVMESSEALSNQQATLTSTPKEDQGDDAGKGEGLNETATDSGMGNSGIFSETSAQTKTSDCKLVGTKTFSTFRSLYEDDYNQVPRVTKEAPGPLKPMFPKGFLNGRKSAEWKPLRPKWHSKHDPEYFHCHQDTPVLCDYCDITWGGYVHKGQKWDGEDWVS